MLAPSNPRDVLEEFEQIVDRALEVLECHGFIVAASRWLRGGSFRKVMPAERRVTQPGFEMP
jgi:GTP-sensing pleiotropic transcriptional regulator CodY